MHICIFAHETSLWGATRSLIGLIDNLLKYGVEISVITRGKGVLNEILNQKGVFNKSYDFYWWMVQDRPRNKHLMWLVKFIIEKRNEKITHEIVDLLRERNIDIIHTNDSVIDIGARTAKILGIPHIWHIREYGKEDKNLIFINGEKNSIEYMMEHSERMIYVSRDLYQHYKRMYTGLGKGDVIYNGIDFDLSKTLSVTKDYEIECPTLVVCGSISKEKNQLEVLKALSILNKRNRKMKCLIIGSGKDEYVKILKKFICDNDIKHMVDFLGYQNNVFNYFEKAQLAIVPSYREAFGRVTIEYMLAGLGVIASNTGANPELIEDNVTGKLYKLGDCGNLADKIDEFLMDRKSLLNIACNAKKDAERRFLADINAANVFKVYKQILSDSTDAT